MEKKRILALTVIALILLAAGAAFSWHISRPPKPNVIFLLLDALRAEHLGVNGYERDTSPILDKFTRENLHFPNAITTSTWTPSSVASIMTGLYTATHGFMPPNDPLAAWKVARLDQKLMTLPEIFRSNGYQTGAVSSNPWITKNFGFDKGFESFQSYNRVDAENINEAARKEIERFFKKKAPFFLYLHYMDTHNRYDPPAQYRDLYKGPLRRWNYSEKDQKKIGLYDGEIRYLDGQLGELFEYLKAKGLYDDAVIIIAADHGEQFHEHGHQGHGYSLHNEELLSFLVFKGPGLKGKVDTISSHADILPTIMDITGLESPPGIQGVSLLSNLSYRKQYGILSEIRMRDFNFKSFTDPTGKKMIIKYPLDAGWLPEPSETPLSVDVYDSLKDYWEQTPLTDDTLKARLMADYIEFYTKVRKVHSENEFEKTEIDKKTINELKSLGYLSGNE